WGAERYLSENNIHFKPALNEELAATAIIGTQQVGLHPGAKTDGVFSLWYGKGVGADRASDALKHASLMGTSPKGGVLVVVGDDHGAKSSATAHQCDQAMESWMMPFLYPSDFDEYLDFGLLGYAMSRYAGCYVGFKVVSETVEAGSVVALTEGLPEIVEPDDYQCPPDGLNIRSPDPQLHQEARQINQRLKAVQAFARANRIDKEIWPSKDAKIGIVTVGKAHGDFLQALEDLGLDEKESRSRGIALYKIGMPWPLEPEGIREFADGLDVLVVIEEKRNFVERQIKDVLFNMERDRRPMVLGKTDQDGQNLLSSSGQITSADVARVLVRVVQGLKDYEPAARYLAFLDRMGEAQKDWPVGMRLPHYCSGCPHSISTRVPDGSHALTGTGCHLMAAFMKRSTSSFLQMGGDGINWLGQAPFTKTKHVFQNLGDGTYFHSGSLGIRQAVAAGVNMTFKILFNDAVA
ncbi:MAG TPA: indolepyruvate ferredoxin oxidoreductase family protein, partial [Rhodospirillales bacterium]|nr:indolepyruvate ferredoxin oxidoreductase family protein [Rhodospirillales bacterium]